MSSESPKFVPPYGVPWDTFLSTIERMDDEAGDGLPQRIDRSYLSKQSGNTQTYLMQAFRNFGLTDEANTPTATLKSLVEAPSEERPALMARLLQSHFDPILQLGLTNATQGQLEEKWSEVYGQTGETRRKAIRFFLSGCAYSKIALSKLWKAPRATAPGTRRTRQPTKKDPAPGGAGGAQGAGAMQRGDGDSYQVTLLGGGTVTVTVSESHFNLSKFRKDREFVFGLVDAMTEYASASDQDVAVSADGAETQEAQASDGAI